MDSHRYPHQARERKAVKTVVFHSVKGGVGRSLALCNLAHALAGLGKRVLVLDFDYVAPGLHRKLGRPPGRGYIDYLMHFSVEARAATATAAERWRVLEPLVDKVADNLWLLRAGDETSLDYWRTIASYEFHCRFYWAYNEVVGLNEGAFPLRWLDLNINAFRNDKRLIAETPVDGPHCLDYLLVDCKATVDSNAFLLLDWPDAIGHFFPCNLEGKRYAFMTATSLVREAITPKQNPRFIPVVSRVPDHMAEEDETNLRLAISEAWNEAWNEENKGSAGEIPFAAQLFRPADFVLLSEMHQLETDEEVLFARAREYPHRSRKLGHDYLELFARLAPLEQFRAADDEKNIWTASENSWYNATGADSRSRILTKKFDRYPHLGTMLNDDNQANLAVRVRTFHLFGGGLFEYCEKEMKARFSALKGAPDAQLFSPLDRQEALRFAGRRCGKDFAEELTETFATMSKVPTLKDRVSLWAELDSQAGFGTIQAEAITAAPPDGWLIVAGEPFGKRHLQSFLQEDATKRESVDEDSDQLETTVTPSDLSGFFQGYVEAVLTGIFASVSKSDGHIEIQKRSPEEVPLKVSERAREIFHPTTRLDFYFIAPEVSPQS